MGFWKGIFGKQEAAPLQSRPSAPNGSAAIGQEALREEATARVGAAIKQGNMQEIRRLVEAGADINKPDIGGAPPLYLAGVFDNIVMITLLLDWSGGLFSDSDFDWFMR